MSILQSRFLGNILNIFSICLIFISILSVTNWIEKSFECIMAYKCHHFSIQSQCWTMVWFCESYQIGPSLLLYFGHFHGKFIAALASTKQQNSSSCFWNLFCLNIYRKIVNNFPEFWVSISKFSSGGGQLQGSLIAKSTILQWFHKIFDCKSKQNPCSTG